MEAKELQVVEFEIKKLTPAKIECNIEEVEIYMTAVKEKYNGWIVTEDGIDFAKKERTKLNKLEKILSEERKRIQKEANTDIEKFMEKLKIAEKEAKALSNNISEQIKDFEENSSNFKRILFLPKNLYILLRVVKTKPKSEYSIIFNTSFGIISVFSSSIIFKLLLRIKNSFKLTFLIILAITVTFSLFVSLMSLYIT